MPSAVRRVAPRPTRPRIRTKACVAALVFGSMLVWGGTARAQSLNDLYQAAHGYDAAYLAARANLDAAQLRYAQARGLRAPQVGLSVTAGRQLNNSPNATTYVYDSTAATATLSATQPIYNPANEATIDQAEKAVDAYRSDLESAEQDLILRVAQAYFDVLAAQDNLETARASQAAIAESVASAKRNFEVGTATITDTREAQARYDLARFTQIQSENDLTSKRIVLDQTVGRTGVIPRPLQTPFVMPPLSPPNVEDWVTSADTAHPAIRKARDALDIARLDTTKAKAGNLPTLSLNGSYARGKSTNAIVLPPGVAYNYNSPTTVSQIGVTLNLPLFAGYQVQNRIKETVVLEDKTLDDLDATRRGVSQTTRQLFFVVGSDTAQVGALEAAESSSKLALEATQLGFKVGVRVNIDVLNAQAQLYTTRAQLAKARYDLIMAGLRLRQAAGQLMPQDVAEVNRLLVQN